MALLQSTAPLEYGEEPFKSPAVVIAPPWETPTLYVDVSGDISPSITASYLKMGDHLAYPYYQHETYNYTIWWSDTLAQGTYIIGDCFPEDPGENDHAWIRAEAPLHDVEGEYLPLVGTTGNPIVGMVENNGYAVRGDTFILRTRHKVPKPEKKRKPELHNFGAAILAVRDIWNIQLTQADRDFWQSLSEDRDGARPNMKPSPSNGWDLFSQYAYAIVVSGATPPNGWHVQEGWPCKNVYLVDAHYRNSLLTITAEYELRQEGTDFIMIFQINPAFIGKRDATRHTWLIHYHPMPPHAPLIDTFTAVAHWKFRRHDTVQILARAHITSLEVKNFTPSIRARWT